MNNKRVWIKSFIVAVIATPIVLIFHVPIWIPILIGVVWVVFGELQGID